MGKTAFVFDNGLFVEVAKKLADTGFFDKVYYYRHYISPFIKEAYDTMGKGVEGIETVDNYVHYKDKADVFIFPDINNEDIQWEFRRDGLRVWGMGDSEWLENDRWKTAQWQQKVGLPVPERQRVVGVDKLSRVLENHEPAWIKISYYRGDMETWKHEVWWKTENTLKELRHTLGVIEKDTEFIIEEPIDGFEVGFDGWTIDGRFPERCAFGFEVKDVGYVGRVVEYQKMPSPLIKVNDQLAKVFLETKARGFFSSEVRVAKDKKPFLIDPCIRCGSPPTEGTIELYTNLAEIIWEGSAGKMVSPKVEAEYVAIAMIHSEDALHGWVPLDIPRDVRRWVKIKQSAVIDGKHYFIPSDIPMKEIGAVVGLGSSIKEAIKKCTEVAEEVDGQEIDIHVESFDKAFKVLEEAKAGGIEF